MNFFKKLFGSSVSPSEEEQKEAEGKEFDVLKYDGMRAFKTGETVFAIECFRHALRLQEDLEVRDYLSQALIQSNELLKAYDELQKLADAEPDNIQIVIRMAHVAYMMENYTVMGDACERGKLLDKDNVDINYLYARACLGMGDLVNTIAMLTKTISLDEDYVSAYQLRGETLLKMGDVEGADADVAWLLNHDETNEDALLLKARIEEAQQNHASAMEFYGKVIAQNPFNVDAFRERGAIRLAQGDKQGAEEDMKQVLELSPEMQQEVSGDYSN